MSFFADSKSVNNTGTKRSGTPELSAKAEKFPGQMQLVSFERLKMHLGDEWPQHKMKVQNSVKEVLHSELGPWDFSALIGQDHVLIIFGEDDVSSSEETADRIGQLIETNLGGGCHSTLTDVRRGPGKLTQEILSERDLPFQGSAIYGKKAKQTNFWQPIESTPRTAPDMGRDETFASLNAMQDKSRQEHEVGFAPLWNARQEILAGYAVVPIIRRPNLPSVIGYDVLGKPTMLADIQSIDIEMLRAQMEMAADLMQNNFVSLLSSQIHFDTLSFMSSRKEVLSIAQNIPDWLNKTLMIQLIGVDEHTPASTIAQRTAGLGGRFRAMIIRIPSVRFPLSHCKTAGATVVSYIVPHFQTDEQIVSDAVRIVSEAKKNKLLTCFEHVMTIELASKLKEIGAVFITGSFLGDPVDVPDNMQKLPIADIRAASSLY